MEVGIHEAKTHLSKLLRRVDEGEELIISVGGKRQYRVIAETTHRSGLLGALKGQIIETDPNWWHAADNDELADWEGDIFPAQIHEPKKSYKNANKNIKSDKKI
jgi:prevent-host-death family protein